MKSPEYISELSKVSNPGDIVKKQLENQLTEAKLFSLRKQLVNLEPRNLEDAHPPIAQEIEELAVPGRPNQEIGQAIEPLEYHIGQWSSQKMAKIEADLLQFEKTLTCKKLNRNMLESTKLNEKHCQILKNQLRRQNPDQTIVDPLIFSEFSTTSEKLLTLHRYPKTDHGIMLACSKNLADLTLLHSKRTRKVLRVSQLEFLKNLSTSVVQNHQENAEMALNPSTPSKIILTSHAFYTTPYYDFEKKSLLNPANLREVLNICLKTYGFQRVGGARRAGKSVIIIWNSNSDAGVKTFTNISKISGMQLNSKRPHQTSQHELVFYQEFREEILGFTI